MAVEVTLSGRLGQTLAQYGFARIVAEHHGLALRVVENYLDDLNGPGNLRALLQHFPGVELSLPGLEVEAPVERHVEGENGWGGNQLDFEALLSGPPRKYILNAFFCCARYFLPYRDNLRRWFRVEGIDPPVDVGSNDILVNIRRGQDFARLNYVLPASYYATALASMQSPGRVYVCGFGVDDQIRAVLAPYDPIYVEGSAIEHFALFSRFRRFVISNSSFAWWGAFLADSREVIMPEPFYPPRAAEFFKLDFSLPLDTYRTIKHAGHVLWTPFKKNEHVRVAFSPNGTDTDALVEMRLTLQPDEARILQRLYSTEKPLSLVEAESLATDFIAVLDRLTEHGLVMLDLECFADQPAGDAGTVDALGSDRRSTPAEEAG
jgi:hypothetical protein